MRVLLRTFGCRANQYDAEQVRALVEAAGGTVLDGSDARSAAADVAVLTSCAVTAEAEADLEKHDKLDATRSRERETTRASLSAAKARAAQGEARDGELASDKRKLERAVAALRKK